MAPRRGSTYEALRLAVLDEIAQSTIDSRDRDAVDGSGARPSSIGISGRPSRRSGRRFSNPTEVADRLVRSVVGAGPFEKFFVNPDLADEVSFKRDVITYFTRDGRQVIDSEPTSEAELTRRLPASARRRRSGCRPRESGRRAPGVGQPGASVGLDPARVGLSRRHLPHLPAAPHRPRRPGRARLAQPSGGERRGGLPTRTNRSARHRRSRERQVDVRRRPCCGRHRPRRSRGSCRRSASSTRRTCPAVAGRPRPAGTRSDPSCVARCSSLPQLLVVGETLGEEAFELLKAGNAGCGFLTTLHANSAQLGMQSLVTAALMAGENVPERVVRVTFARLIDLVIHCEAEPLHRVAGNGRRRRQVMEISVVPAADLQRRVRARAALRPRGLRPAARVRRPPPARRPRTTPRPGAAARASRCATSPTDRR